jgi:hypothetical protein
MKVLKVIAAVLVLSFAVAPAANAAAKHARTKSAPTGSHTVRGHVTKNGSYVRPHRQTNPNSTKRDNWSTKGNVNPYTGKPGTKRPN